MKIATALATLLAMLLTLGMVWWLYPIKPASVGLLFAFSFILSFLFVAVVKLVLNIKEDKNEKTNQTPD